MSGGMTPQGFIAPTTTEEVTDLGNSFLANIDAALDLSADQPIGQAIAIFAEKFSELMQLGATVYNALNPNDAEAQLLTNVAAISGTYRQVATYSTVTLNLTLNATTTVNAGATAIVNGVATNIWVLQADVTSTTAGVYPATFQSQNPGPQPAAANTITIIGTPTIGWTAVTNPADAVLGLAADTDTTLRQKRAAELLGEGSGDLDAIVSAVQKVGGVVQVFGSENTSLQTDATGLPGRAFRIVVWDGPGLAASNNEIAQAIWDTKPAGALSFGTGANSGVAIDVLGNSRTVLFDRAVQVPIYIICTTTPGTLTTAQTSAVKEAFAAFAVANYNLDISVIALALRAAGIINGVTTDVPTFFLGTAPSPSGTANIPISGLQIATISTALGDVLVNGI